MTAIIEKSTEHIIPELNTRKRDLESIAKCVKCEVNKTKNTTKNTNKKGLYAGGSDDESWIW